MVKIFLFFPWPVKSGLELRPCGKDRTIRVDEIFSRDGQTYKGTENGLKIKIVHFTQSVRMTSA